MLTGSYTDSNIPERTKVHLGMLIFPPPLKHSSEKYQLHNSMWADCLCQLYSGRSRRNSFSTKRSIV